MYHYNPGDKNEYYKTVRYLFVSLPRLVFNVIISNELLCYLVQFLF